MAKEMIAEKKLERLKQNPLYWWAKLEGSVERGEKIEAEEAFLKLKELGVEVQESCRYFPPSLRRQLVVSANGRVNKVVLPSIVELRDRLSDVLNETDAIRGLIRLAEKIQRQRGKELTGG